MVKVKWTGIEGHLFFLFFIILFFSSPFIISFGCPLSALRNLSLWYYFFKGRHVATKTFHIQIKKQKFGTRGAVDVREILGFFWCCSYKGRGFNFFFFIFPRIFQLTFNGFFLLCVHNSYPRASIQASLPFRTRAKDLQSWGKDGCRTMVMKL